MLQGAEIQEPHPTPPLPHIMVGVSSLPAFLPHRLEHLKTLQQRRMTLSKSVPNLPKPKKNSSRSSRFQPVALLCLSKFWIIRKKAYLKLSIHPLGWVTKVSSYSAKRKNYWEFWPSGVYFVGTPGDVWSQSRKLASFKDMGRKSPRTRRHCSWNTLIIQHLPHGGAASMWISDQIHKGISSSSENNACTH